MKLRDRVRAVVPSAVTGATVVIVLLEFFFAGPLLLSWPTFVLAYGQWVVVDQLGPAMTTSGSAGILAAIYATVTVLIALVSAYVPTWRRWLACIALWCAFELSLLALIYVFLQRGIIVIE